MRLLSAESYKLKRSRNFYICMAVLAGLVFLTYGILALVDSIQQGEMENGTAGIMVTVEGQAEALSGSVWDQVGVMDVLQRGLFGDALACVLAIFVSIFVISEYSSGMLKNIVGKGCPRTVIFLSKLAAAVLAALLMTLAGVAVSVIGGWLFIGGIGGHEVIVPDWQDFFIYVGQQFMITAALASVFAGISEACRNLAAGISIGIGISVFTELLFQGLDMLWADSGITVSQYWLVTRSAVCPTTGFSAGYVTQTALVAAFWFLAAAAFGVWHFNKTDIK